MFDCRRVSSLVAALALASSASAAAASPAVVPFSHCVFAGGQTLEGTCGRVFDQEPEMRLARHAGEEFGAWRTDAHPSAVWVGDMTDEGNRNVPIELEVYTDRSGIFRTEYGWFRVTNFASSPAGIAFDLDTSREVPPNDLDRRIVQRAAAILSSASVWNRADNRRCTPQATTWSIYCAMEKANAELSGGVDHRRPGMEVVRLIIEDRTRGRNYHHRLMDYNNDATTTLADVQSIFAEALQRTGDLPWLEAHDFAPESRS